MAVGCTITERYIEAVKKITWAWTSAADGTLTGVTTTTTAPYDGKLLGFATIPDGSTAPDDNYDVTVTDSNGHDVLLGAGANRDTANTEYANQTTIAAVASSKLTLAVSGAGSGKKGTVILWIK